MLLRGNEETFFKQYFDRFVCAHLLGRGQLNSQEGAMRAKGTIPGKTLTCLWAIVAAMSPNSWDWTLLLGQAGFAAVMAALSPRGDVITCFVIILSPLRL